MVLSGDDASVPAWRATTEIPVPFDDAVDEWAAAAREVLIETAQHYGALITQAELAARVQADTGIKAGGPVRLWIDDLLGAVTRRRHEGEPLLASLCVRLDQTVGEAYVRAVDVAGLPRPGDADEDAAVVRFRCHEFFGAAMPEHARPTLAPRVAEKRAGRKSAKPAKKAAAKKSAAAGDEPGTGAAPTKPRAAKAARPKAEPKEEPKPKLCPTCFTVLPASGVCNYCE